MNPIELLKSRRAHVRRLANENGADGELAAVAQMDRWVARPRGKGLKVLLGALRERGIEIRWSSFDAVCLPSDDPIEFDDRQAVEQIVDDLIFIEVKSSSQERVEPGFAKFFFALTESEIEAAEALGHRHCVALYNRLTDELKITSVPNLLARAKSLTWQLSVQL